MKTKIILLLFFSIIFCIFLSTIVFAGGCLDKNCPGTSNCGCTRYKVDPGETITVYEHDLCQRVTNFSGYPQTFIPAKTQTEWNFFCTYRPNHITCSPCLVSALMNKGLGYHTCAILNNGTVKCWGNNIAGQLGDGTSGNIRTIPVSVSDL